MIEYYSDDKLEIYLSEAPHIDIRYCLPYLTEEEKADIKKYPFQNMKTFKVYIVDITKIQDFEFEIKKNYTWDGATIPRPLWNLIGSKTDNAFLIASCIHDVLCLNHSLINNDRNLSSRIFKALLLASGVNKVKAQIMYLAVDNFQKLCGWNENK